MDAPDISKWPFVKSILTIQAIIYAVGCPLMILFFQFKCLFLSLDIFKLLLLTCSSGCVCYLVLFTFSMMFLTILKKDSTKFTPEQILEFGSIITNVLISLAIIVYAFCEFIQNPIDVFIILFCIIVLQAVSSLGLYIIYLFLPKEPKVKVLAPESPRHFYYSTRG